MRLTVKVNDDLVSGLGRVATIDGRSVDSLVEEALQDYLAKNPPRPMPIRRV